MYAALALIVGGSVQQDTVHALVDSGNGDYEADVSVMAPQQSRVVLSVPMVVKPPSAIVIEPSVNVPNKSFKWPESYETLDFIDLP